MQEKRLGNENELYGKGFSRDKMEILRGAKNTDVELIKDCGRAMLLAHQLFAE